MSVVTEAVLACIGLGSNVGSRVRQLRSAVHRLARHGQISVTAVSPVYETAAHTLDPQEEQPPFLNAVAVVRTTLPPRALLRVCHRLERAAGRRRTRRWAPRPLDLDVLTYGLRSIQSRALTLPHPRVHERRFVLQPWADVTPNLRVPAPFDETVYSLLNQCSDDSPVTRTDHALPSF